MGLKEKMVKRICKITGNPNADLETLKFDKNDANAKQSEIVDPYVEGRKVRTNEEISKEANRNIKKYCDKFNKDYLHNPNAKQLSEEEYKHNLAKTVENLI